VRKALHLFNYKRKKNKYKYIEISKKNKTQISIPMVQP